MQGLIQGLVELSQYAGSDVLLVQGAGGNTSVKDGNRMWIKASGFNLADVVEGSGYLELRLDAISTDEYFERIGRLPHVEAHETAIATVQEAAANPGALRPSVETLFHVALGRYVLHTHSVYANAFTCMRGGRGLLDAPVEWIEYITPGYWLGAEVRRRAGQRTVTRILLENHGPVTAGDTVQEAVAGHESILAAAQAEFGSVPPDALSTGVASGDLMASADEIAAGFAERGWPLPDLRISSFRILNQAAAEPERWLTAGPLIPDDVVYFGPIVYEADDPGEARRVVASLPDLPSSLVVVLRGHGAVLAGPNARFTQAMEEGLAAHGLTRMLIARRGEPQLLPAWAVDEIHNMEAEKHRKKMLSR
jgi:rhamnose utilization protein RhaD (predicted bifunctional aldolase and dehydrogenase)